MNSYNRKCHVVIVGAGFTGLAAAYEIARENIAVTVLEKSPDIGGLASSFRTRGQQLEAFYHHWFKSDRHVMDLVNSLGCQSQLLSIPTKTGVCFRNTFFKLSSPLDVLRFKPLGLLDRVRLGLMVLKGRRVKDWRRLESVTAQEWIPKLCGRKVYEVVWAPLLRGKFGPFAQTVSAVWFWNKLLLRGGSRDRAGNEVLIYYRGGFAALLEKIAHEITSLGGTIKLQEPAEKLIVQNGCVRAVQTPQGLIEADAVIATPALPVIADLLEGNASEEYLVELRAVKYLANLCLVLELSHRLSDIYWINVLDPDFPFVGVIEHTNLVPAETYGGSHIVYLSKYLPETAELYRMEENQIFEFSLPFIERMFPRFDQAWVERYQVFRTPYAQPVVECNYSRSIPSSETPIKGLYIASMAQIYPEDRGTNYAAREGTRIGRLVTNQIRHNNPTCSRVEK
ncbi:MAG TPA: NAD(P)/FAD-dependent oxidoreductase [Sedimentisphaerales bacterium]|nr:NAD(P)/FAD-dependent oxidoreductase [Sedimentisphaerales bacterium]